MVLSSLTRAHAQACGMTPEEAARIVAEANQTSKQMRGDDGICPHQQLKTRMALPNADFYSRSMRSFDYE